MSEITLDTLPDEENRYSIEAGPNSVRLDQREDQGTIQKVKEMEIPPLPPLNTSLEATVSERNAEERLSQMLQELPLEEFETVESLFIENPDRSASYSDRLYAVIGAILNQLHQLSEKDKEKIHQLKIGYKNDTLGAAELQRSLGWTGLIFAGISFSASFLQFLSDFKEDQEIANLFASQVCPKFGDLWSSDLNARLTAKNNGAQLKLNEFSFLSNAQQDQANKRSEMTQILDKMGKGQEIATRAGN